MINKILVIGFPKCGTTSLQKSLTNCGVKSVHWADYNKNEVVGLLIKRAKEENLPLLHYINDYKAVTQMEFCSSGNVCYWPQFLDVPTLEEQYPNSKFIFNHRNIRKWIKSVSNWTIPYYGNLRKRLIKLDIPGLPHGKGESDQDLETWYLWHQKNMIDHFKNKDNFLVFNIEEDHPQKLGDFLNIKDFKLFHLNKGTKNAS